MSYSADSFVADEIPTTAKWNKLWNNDASFNDGTGIGANAILNTAIKSGELYASKIYNPYKFNVYRTAAFTTGVGTSVVVPYDTRNFDTSSNVDIVTNKGRFTAPISGYYQFNANAELLSSSTSIGILLIFKNGLAGTQIGRGNDLRMASANKGMVAEAFVQLTAGDYVEVAIFTDVAVGIDVTAISNNSFSGFLSSAT